ncbi:MAG: ABC transporter ATP-binding protein [Spirochaetales bacterium]|nr:ABC transporter ATP-binding protein [Spirochaetales bacterium]
MSEPRLKADRLSFSYIKGQPVLDKISFSVKPNEIVSVIGPNGGGKTTLLRLMAGLLVPDAGSVTIDGIPAGRCRGRIGYVPQHIGFDRKFPMTVFDVVLSGLIKPLGFYTRRDKAKTEDLLEELGLAELKNRHIGSLSGGQTQRMLIARALVAETDILLLDEPTSNIDLNAGKQLGELIGKIGQKMTVFLVTHDTGFVSALTDRVFCINRTLAEHPADDDFISRIASSYGENSKIVHHETNISPYREAGGVRND